MLDRTDAAQTLQFIDIDMPIVDLVAPLPQQVAHHVLARPFSTARAGDRGELPRGFDLPIERLVHRVENPPLLIG